MKPKEAERIEILTLADNYADLLLPGDEGVARPARDRDGMIFGDTLLAEHGLSILVTVRRGGEEHTILWDTGYSPVTAAHNMDLLGVDPEKIEAVAISHGHMDHTGGLAVLLDRIGRDVDVVVHPDAFLHPRFRETERGERIVFPRTLVEEELSRRPGVNLVSTREPTLLAGGMVMVTGEIPRVTPFEKGLPDARVEREGKVERDTIADDQSLAVLLEGRGLVVISGCAHAGIVNTILHARRLTGRSRVFAVLGGFHLSGARFEAVLEETVKEFEKIAPEVLIPMHCTGWKSAFEYLIPPD